MLLIYCLYQFSLNVNVYERLCNFTVIKEDHNAEKALSIGLQCLDLKLK